MLEDFTAWKTNNSPSVPRSEPTLHSKRLIRACLQTKYGTHLASTCSKSNHETSSFKYISLVWTNCVETWLAKPTVCGLGGTAASHVVLSPLDRWKASVFPVEVTKHKKQTHHISCPSALVPPHSVLADLPAGPDSFRARSLIQQSGDGTAPGWWTSSGSGWSSWASSPSVGARSSGRSSLLREALDTTTVSPAKRHLLPYTHAWDAHMLDTYAPPWQEKPPHPRSSRK